MVIFYALCMIANAIFMYVFYGDSLFAVSLAGLVVSAVLFGQEVQS